MTPRTTWALNSMLSPMTDESPSLNATGIMTTSMDPVFSRVAMDNTIPWFMKLRLLANTNPTKITPITASCRMTLISLDNGADVLRRSDIGQGYGRSDKSTCPNPLYELGVKVLMFKDIKLVIYDLDGVLIDSNKAIVESFRLLHNEIGEPFNPDDVLSRIGVGLLEIFKEILPEKHHDNLAELRLSYIRNFQGLGTEYIRLLDEVEETLAGVKARGFTQSVATNKTTSEAERILEVLGIAEHFDLITGFGTVPRAKPEPDMIIYTLEKFGVKPENAVFVDDTKIGLTAGIRAGVKTIGITTGNNTLDQIKEVKPSTIIHRFSDIPRIIQA